MQDKERKSVYSIQAVENALNVLEAFGEIDGDVRITSLSKSLGMNKSHVFRLLTTFEQRGYIERGEVPGKYRLGLLAYELGLKFLLRMGMLSKAKPAMERLARECGEAVYLAVPRQADVLMLGMVDTTQAVKTVPLVGNSYPLTDSAPGKVILAFREVEDRGPFPPDLEEELQAIGQLGMGHDSGSFGEGTASLAVPLFNGRRQVVGSLCIIGPDFRLAHERLTGELLPPLREAGQIVSASLGYHGQSLI